MLTGSMRRNQQQTDQIHRLAIDGLEIQATLQPDEKSKEALQIQKAGVRYGHPSADPSRTQCLPREKPLQYVLFGYTGRTGGAPRKLRQKLPLVCGAKGGNDPIGGKQRVEIHIQRLGRLNCDARLF